MKDDVIDTDWKPQELSLLGSANVDAAPDGAVERTLTALGVGVAVGASGAAVAAGASPAQAVASKASSVWLKWLTSALVGGGAVGAALVALTGSPEPTAAPSNGDVPSRAAPATSVAAAKPELGLLARHDGGASAQAVPSALPALPHSKPSAERETSRRPLSEEIRAIDDARSQLRRGNPRAALEALARYDAMVAGHGSMRAEATVVRIEALQATGDSAGAAALGQRFLAKNPGSAYADYVRRVLALPK
jgi:hypothetical protein